MCNKNGISRGVGGGGPFCELILENPERMGVISKIPSVGGYGYFLELHIGCKYCTFLVRIIHLIDFPTTFVRIICLCSA